MFTDILRINKHIYIEDQEYLDEIEKKKKELKEVEEKFTTREKGFIPLSYAKAIYEMEKGNSLVCRFNTDDFHASHTVVFLEVSHKYRMTEGVSRKLLSYLEYKMSIDKPQNNKAKQYKINHVNFEKQENEINFKNLQK